MQKPSYRRHDGGRLLKVKIGDDGVSPGDGNVASFAWRNIGSIAVIGNVSAARPPTMRMNVGGHKILRMRKEGFISTAFNTEEIRRKSWSRERNINFCRFKSSAVSLYDTRMCYLKGQSLLAYIDQAYRSIAAVGSADCFASSAVVCSPVIIVSTFEMPLIFCLKEQRMQYT